MNISITHNNDGFFGGSDTTGINVSASIAKFCALQQAAMQSRFPDAMVIVTSEDRLSTCVYVEDGTYEQEQDVQFAAEATGTDIYDSQSWIVTE